LSFASVRDSSSALRKTVHGSFATSSASIEVAANTGDEFSDETWLTWMPVTDGDE
jgi:hypothetical protein